MRRGRLVKSCTKCGRDVTKRRCAQCGNDRTTWGYRVDVAPVGSPRRQKSRRGFPTKAVAQEALHELLEQLRSGSYVETSKLTLGRYLTEEWLPSIRGEIRPGTFDAYAGHVRLYIIPRIGDVFLQQVSRGQVRAFYQSLIEDGGARGGRLSPKTVHNVHVTLRKALGDAVKANLIPRNPADGAHKRPEDPEMKTWTAGELRAFLEHVKADRLFALWRVLASSGIRRGEVLGLRWNDIDLERGSASIARQRVKAGGSVSFAKTKTKRGARTVALDPATVVALRSHRTQQAEERLLFGPAYQDENLVFCHPAGRPLDPDGLTERFQRHVRDAGVPRIRLHDLRHTHASIALQAGVPVKVVSERLGHASVAFTMDVYAHVLPGMQEEAAERIAAIVDGI